VPSHKGVLGDWTTLVYKDVGKSGRRVVRSVYEICTFQALRERDFDDLVASWTLVDADTELLAGRHEATRLSFALMLKFFEIDGRFPRHVGEVPPAAVDYVARQLGLVEGPARRFEVTGRTAERNRTQIREALGFRVLTRAINWDLITQQYDQMIKCARALQLGTAEAEQILRRFTGKGPKHPTLAAIEDSAAARTASTRRSRCSRFTCCSPRWCWSTPAWSTGSSPSRPGRSG